LGAPCNSSSSPLRRSRSAKIVDAHQADQFAGSWANCAARRTAERGLAGHPTSRRPQCSIRSDC
jgi:hypothetical protein